MKKTPTYTYICFTDLAYEFNFSEKQETEKKIKRRLKYYKKEIYNQDKIEYIRNLKNDLYQEISKGSKSKYFQKPKSKYADLSDYNIEKMTKDYLVKYDKITNEDLINCINFAVYLYHMR